jgi:hypothetical protein
MDIAVIALLLYRREHDFPPSEHGVDRLSPSHDEPDIRDDVLKIPTARTYSKGTQLMMSWHSNDNDKFVSTDKSPGWSSDDLLDWIILRR